MQVLIADNQALFREGLKKVLSEQVWITSVVETDNIETAFSLIDLLPSRAVLLIDIALAGGVNLDLLKRVRSKKPLLPIMVLGQYPEEHYVMRVLKEGANGYLTKVVPVEQFLLAVKKIASGNRYISPLMAEKMAERICSFSNASLHDALSDREFEILCLLAGGRSPKQIAEELYLSISTVSTHRKRILKKMNMQTTAELVFYAIKYNLV